MHGKGDSGRPFVLAMVAVVGSADVFLSEQASVSLAVPWFEDDLNLKVAGALRRLRFGARGRDGCLTASRMPATTVSTPPGRCNRASTLVE